MKKLIDKYSYKIVDHKAFYKVFMPLRNEVFKDSFTVQTNEYSTERELNFYKTLKHIDVFRLYILVYNEQKEVIGWHVGFQKGPSFYMMNTGVIEQYQRKGIYTALLQKIIAIVFEKGFIDITSKHNASNNSVIIPKLKAGFIISGMEIDETFGTLVNLKYFFNEKIKNVYLMRTGDLKPSDAIMKKQ